MIHYERMQKRLEAILNSMGDAVIFAYHDGRIRQVNPTFDTLFGYGSDEIHRARLVYLAEAEYQEGLQAAVMRVQHHDTTERLTLTAQRKDGSTFVSDWVISLVNEDDESGVVCMVRDVTEDKRVKKSLKSTKEYLRLLVNTAPVTLQIIDPDGLVVLSEGQALDYLRPAPDQIAGQSVANLYADAPQLLANIQRALAGDVVREVHALGEYFLETICVPSWDDIGTLEHIIVVQVDITSHKRDQQELARKERRYRALFEQSNDAVFLLDLDGRIFDSNQRALDLLGYSHEELTALYCYELVMTAQRESCHATFRELQQGIIIPPYERLFQRKDGSSIAVEVNMEMVRNGGGHALHVQSIVRDISERHAHEQKFRSVVEQSQDGVVLATSDGLIVEWNDGLERMTGITRAEAMQQPLWVLMGKMSSSTPPSPAEGLRFKFNAQVRHLSTNPNHASIYEHWIERRSDGAQRLIQYQPFAIPDQHLVGTIVRDVTTLRAAQESAFQLRLEQEKVRLMNQFIQNVAHEFRTPLSIINNNAYLVQSDPNIENHDRYAGMIERQQQAILRLVETLQRMTRLESLDTLPMEPDDLAGLLRVVLQKLAGTYANKGLELHARLPERMRLPMNSADLYAAFYEIIDNAYRFTPDGGTIQVSIRDEQDFALVMVDDSGVGIQPDNLPHVFEKLYREDEAHSTRGFGLGLAIAKRVIELHGGAITLHSEPHRGTTVMVYLPMG